MTFIRDITITKNENEALKRIANRLKTTGAIRERTRTLKIVKKYKTEVGDVAGQIYQEIISESVDDVCAPVPRMRRKS